MIFKKLDLIFSGLFVLGVIYFSVVAVEPWRSLLLIGGVVSLFGYALFLVARHRTLKKAYVGLKSIKEKEIAEAFKNEISRSGLPNLFGNTNDESECDDENPSEEESVTDKKVMFQDVAGCDEEKIEVKEVIEFLKNPEKFSQIGATIPKGILFVGPPGTGKTLLAKAVAGEAGVNFINVSGSEFVEKYVGIGAKRVRDLFKKAKKNAPTLIFIDEIDAIGRQRGGNESSSNEEREQTLNQLLVEMDGFANKTNVVVIAATNRPELLDKALLRPGRFDRQIMISLPDTKARKEILQVHSKNKPLEPSINFDEIAKKTYGFSGADLASMLNEAALLAVRENKLVISAEEIYEAIDRVMMGPSKKSRQYTEKDKKLVAYHEAGHALIGILLGESKVERITIVPRGNAGGYTSYSQKDDKYFPSQSELEAKIVSLLGGRAAEEIIFNEVTTGARSDLKSASQTARSIVAEYGMSNLGLVQFESSNSNYSGYANIQRNYSEDIAKKIDEEVHAIINQSYEKAKKLLVENRTVLELLVQRLLEQDTLNSEEIEEISKKLIS